MWPAVPRTIARAAADFMAAPARALASAAEREGRLLRVGWSADRAGRGPHGCARRPEDRGDAELPQTLFPTREKAAGLGRNWPEKLRGWCRRRLRCGSRLLPLRRWPSGAFRLWPGSGRGQ